MLTEQPDRKEFRGFKERQGQEERLAPPVLPGRPERMEPLARKEFKASRGHREFRDHKASKDRPDRRVRKACRGHKIWS